MRLLFVGTVKGGGGIESHFITLSRAMVAAGHEVAAVVHPDSVIRRGLDGSGVEIFPGVFRNAFDPRGFRAVSRAIRRFKPDWVIGSYSKEYWPLVAVTRLHGVPLALFRHMDFPMRFLTHRFIPRLAQRFITISAYMRDTQIARGVDARHLHFLYNPLIAEDFVVDAAMRLRCRAESGWVADEVVVGFVGAMHPDKGIFTLFEAVSQVMRVRPQVRMLWVGRGPAQDELAARIDASEFADRHVRLGWSDDVRQCYARMDVLAVPSVSNETFGRVSMEAQACGVPVLCSTRGGIPESLHPGETGALVPPGEVPAWREAILGMVDDAQQRGRMGAAGPRWVAAQFGAPIIARQLAELLSTPE